MFNRHLFGNIFEPFNLHSKSFECSAKDYIKELKGKIPKAVETNASADTFQLSSTAYDEIVSMPRSHFTANVSAESQEQAECQEQQQHTSTASVETPCKESCHLVQINFHASKSRGALIKIGPGRPRKYPTGESKMASVRATQAALKAADYNASAGNAFALQQEKGARAESPLNDSLPACDLPAFSSAFGGMFSALPDASQSAPPALADPRNGKIAENGSFITGPLGVPMLGSSLGGAPAGFGGQMLGSQMLGSQMLGSQMLGSQMLGSQMLGGQMLGSQMLGSQMLGGQMLGGQMLGSQMLGGQMLGGQMLGGQMLGSQTLGGQMLKGQMLGSQMLGGQAFANQMSAPQKIAQSYPTMQGAFAGSAPLGGTAMIGSKRVRPRSPTLYDCDVDWLPEDNLMHILAEEEGFQPL
jgi:hypothetical protein